MSTTLAQMRYWTQYLVGDTNKETYDDTMYKDAINFAVEDYVQKTGVTYTEASILPDTNGFITIPTDYMRVHRVIYPIGSVATQLVETTFKFEAMKYNTWQVTAGEPARWLIWNGSKIKITPVPATPVFATVGYIQKPTDMVLDADVVDPRIPDRDVEELKYAAAFWLLQLTGDNQSMALAQQFMQEFNALIGYSDPVLEAKLNRSRTQGIREV